MTVWSSDSGVTHEPPHNIVMKGQRFFVSDEMSTRLINQDGEVIFFLMLQKQHSYNL